MLSKLIVDAQPSSHLKQLTIPFLEMFSSFDFWDITSGVFSDLIGHLSVTFNGSPFEKKNDLFNYDCKGYLSLHPGFLQLLRAGSTL